MKGQAKEIGKEHSFYTVFSKDERGLQRVKLLTWQIEVLFDLSIHHPLCRFLGSSHADRRAPSLLFSIRPIPRAGNWKGHHSGEMLPSPAAHGPSLPLSCRGAHRNAALMPSHIEPWGT